MTTRLPILLTIYTTSQVIFGGNGSGENLKIMPIIDLAQTRTHLSKQFFFFFFSFFRLVLIEVKFQHNVENTHTIPPITT